MTKKILFTILIAIIGYYIYDFISTNYSEIKDYELKINYSYLFLSVVFFLMFSFYTGYIWYSITKLANVHLCYYKSCKAWAFSQLSKYIPGKVGLFAHRLYLYKKENKNLYRVSYCLILELALSIISECTVFAFMTLHIKNEFVMKYRFISIFIIVMGLAFIHPRLLRIPIYLIGKFQKKEIHNFEIKYSGILKIFFLSIFKWLILGCGFVAICKSIYYELEITNYPYLLASYILAYISGLVCFFAPSGIGVVEGILILSLKVIIPISVVIPVVIFARIWRVFGELIVVSVICFYDLLVKWYNKKRKEIISEV